jgi:hypothetical protein
MFNTIRQSLSVSLFVILLISCSAQKENITVREGWKDTTVFDVSLSYPMDWQLFTNNRFAEQITLYKESIGDTARYDYMIAITKVAQAYKLNHSNFEDNMKAQVKSYETLGIPVNEMKKIEFDGCEAYWLSGSIFTNRTVNRGDNLFSAPADSSNMVFADCDFFHINGKDADYIISASGDSTQQANADAILKAIDF